MLSPDIRNEKSTSCVQGIPLRDKRIWVALSDFHPSGNGTNPPAAFRASVTSMPLSMYAEDALRLKQVVQEISCGKPFRRALFRPDYLAVPIDHTGPGAQDVRLRMLLRQPVDLFQEAGMIQVVIRGYDDVLGLTAAEQEIPVCNQLSGTEVGRIPAVGNTGIIQGADNFLHGFCRCVIRDNNPERTVPLVQDAFQRIPQIAAPVCGEQKCILALIHGVRFFPRNA